MPGHPSIIPNAFAAIRAMKKRGGSYGSGRRRRHHRTMHGRGLFSWLKKAHDWVKNNKVISTIGSALSGVPVIGNVAGVVGSVADTLGYGRRRRRKMIGGTVSTALGKLYTNFKSAYGGKGRRRRLKGGFLGISAHA